MSSLALLVGIADHGSLSAGARSVGMAQSNATRAVKTLERRLGFPLLSRATTGSKLTQEGTLVVEWAREALQSLNTLWTGAQALAAPADREFTFAASMTVAEHLAPTWIGRLHEVDPRIKTKLRVMNSREVIAAVNNRDVALGFVETPDVPPQLSSTTVWTDELVLIAPPGHPWATRREPVTLRELAATHLVEREAGSGTRAFLDERVGAARATPIVEFNSNSAICQSVSAGMGPAVLSRLAVEGSLRMGSFIQVPLHEGNLVRNLQAIWRGPAPSEGPAAMLLGICAQARSGF
ncbi:LysR family transcriptional regulator [Paeniglutamicibacter kerguelensis]|uniref:Molybdate transport repressor ModE-like protein n=1 Tax=Paeniglutamicibacter kerguelensis TaxID=254788 RepID=A0ABS4XMH5_9MICC|nr:LysR family transcriptional regulator [Paeniglutamicibacter kerguelensis]MBP2388869.1 molybdate transport repressor ModE-like protein [Paeniglutamicibacter kerguelensis]